jgi:hypothetical protein
MNLFIFLKKNKKRVGTLSILQFLKKLRTRPGGYERKLITAPPDWLTTQLAQV